jgi:hypothetical protein
MTARQSKPQEREIMANKRRTIQDFRKRWARRRSAALSAKTDSRLRFPPEVPYFGRRLRRWRGGK